jgi:hypothetical protein
MSVGSEGNKSRATATPDGGPTPDGDFAWGKSAEAFRRRPAYGSADAAR